MHIAVFNLRHLCGSRLTLVALPEALEPSSVHRFRVRAHTSAGAGAWSSEASGEVPC